MAAPADVNKKRSLSNKNFKKNAILILPQIWTLNTMVSFVILLIARPARIACADRHTYIHTYIIIYRHAHETTTVTLALAAHAHSEGYI